MKSIGSQQRGVQDLAKVLCPPIGSQFEDVLRRMIMLGENDPRDRWDRLLFDFDNINLTSSQLKERLRDGMLGYERGAHAY